MLNLTAGKTIMNKITTISLILLSILLSITACQSAEETEPIVEETAVVPLPTTTSQPTHAPTSPPTATPSPIPLPTALPTSQPTPFTPPNIQYLQATIETTLADFPGVSSYIIIDLQTGEQINHNPDIAIAGMSIIKIPLLVETFRALDNPPGIEQTKLLTQTTSVSSNFAANLLLRDVVGNGNIYTGADTLNQSMRDLGIYNTFIAVPYDFDPPLDRPQTFLTPANQRTDITTRPDPFRQTTIGDLTALMTEIYTCAQTGSSKLIETYPNQITSNECQEILDLLTLNDLARLLENGLPENAPFSHKVGWIDDTHGNIGIVFGPERDYLIGMALYLPNWLEWEDSAPIFAEVSRLTYAHFNEPEAYPPNILANPPTTQATPTPIPTPELPQAIVFGTQGIGLTLRDQPGGNEIAILPEGTIVSLLTDMLQEQGGITWQKIRTIEGTEGWVGTSFLTTSGDK